MSRFRGTVWPGVVLPEPWIYRPDLVVVRDLIVWPNLLRRGDAEHLGGAAVLPPEVVTRELIALDVADQDGVLEFLRRFGWISDDGIERRIEDWQPTREPDPEEFRAAGVDPNGGWSSIVSIVEAQYLLDEVQACARWMLGDTDLSESWFRDTMNRHLDRFSPRLLAAERESGSELVSDDRDLIDALVCQLVNLLSEGAMFHRCPICSTRFVRQRGRARAGQHRVAGGVMYCSANCANTASTRLYRERKRRENGAKP